MVTIFNTPKSNILIASTTSSEGTTDESLFRVLCGVGYEVGHGGGQVGGVDACFDELAEAGGVGDEAVGQAGECECDRAAKASRALSSPQWPRAARNMASSCRGVKETR